jgi:hypothetical protein
MTVVIEQLGLRADTCLDDVDDAIAKFRIFLMKLNGIDFGSVAYQLMYPSEGEGLTIEQATAAIEQYRQFLIIVYKYPDRTLRPSRLVDQVWHCHLLDSQRYRTDCMEIFGRFVDHYPFE